MNLDGSGTLVLISISTSLSLPLRWTGRYQSLKLKFILSILFFFLPLPFHSARDTRLSRGMGARQTRGPVQGRASSCLAEERHEARINCQNTRR